MKTKLVLFFGASLALSLLWVIPISAQEPLTSCEEFEFFPETEHAVCDRFLDFFNTRGGLAIFGYPLTDQFIEDGRLVQYFQRVRMEYHPENPPAYHVQLGLLGEYFAPPDKRPPIPDSEKPKSNDRDRRYFPETGHTVQFNFLKFYDEKGGLDIFGYPLTEFTLENNRFVQYFQRALMEWNPNQGGIILHDLGEMWIDAHPELGPMQDPSTGTGPGAVTDLSATASVRDAFTGREGFQTVWVYVYDQSGEPLPGAEVTLMVQYAAGEEEESKSMPPTDEAGHTETIFELKDPPRGELVVIVAEVSYQGLQTQAQTSFFPWW